jgi:hypothetical protein
MKGARLALHEVSGAGLADQPDTAADGPPTTRR